MMFINRITLISIVIISLALGFGGGFGFNKFQTASTAPLIQTLINQDSGKPVDVDFALFWEVWSALNSKYVDPTKIDKQKLVHGAISGMVESIGDPYTVFFEPVISKKFEEEISGAFGGVGIEIGKKEDILTVIAPIPESPAMKAGIKAGDRILGVDTKTTNNMSVEEAVNLIRGKKGTDVVLTILPVGKSKPQDFTLTRDTIKVPSTKLTFLDDKTAYLQIYSFSRNVDSDFEEAASKILKSGSTKLVIDLRNNPGGLLDSAINISGWLLENGQTVVMEEFRDKTKNEFTASGNGALKGLKIAILINGGSASASEILAGALHDNNNATLVGEKSFGKGSVQELEKFKNDSSLKVTIAKWLTPKGKSISDEGISPDVEIKIEEKDLENIEFGVQGKDPQLDKAIELLK